MSKRTTGPGASGGISPKIAEVISFVERAAARTLATGHTERIEPDMVNSEAMEPTLDLGGAVRLDSPWRFDHQDVYVDEYGGVCFLNERVRLHIAKVFGRWGFDLEDFTGRHSDMVAAYTVFVVRFGEQSRAFAGWALEIPANACDKDVSLDYIQAVHAGDKKAVNRLFQSSGIVLHMAKTRDYCAAEKAARLKPRKPRSDARENPVIGAVLRRVLPGARSCETFADFTQAYFRQQLAVDRMLHESVPGRSPAGGMIGSRKLNPMLHCHDMWFTPAWRELCDMGLVTFERCPRYDDTAVLFLKAKLAAFLDGTELRDTWRADLGPFVGFDSSFRLITEQDLEWWRLTWAHAEQSFGSALAEPKAPLEARRKLLSLSPNFRKARKADAPTATFYFDGKQHVLCLGEHLVNDKDSFLLGGMAAMCGVKTVATDVDEGPFMPVVLKAMRGSHSDELLRGLKSQKKVVAYETFHKGLRRVNYPEKAFGDSHGPGVRAHWDSEFAAKAVALAPKGMLRFERLVQAESGGSRTGG